jgi:hypothetical protein
MKGFELVKREDHWDLYNEDGHKIASTLDGCNSKLSIKNCEAIERGYDLFELAYDSSKEFLIESTHSPSFTFGYEQGFQKALEILGNKKFSEEDMLKAIAFGWDYEGRPKEEMLEIHNVNLEYNNSYFEDTHKYIQSLQQTEFDVEILMGTQCRQIDCVDEGELVKSKIVKNGETPMLDKDGFLILKRIEK